MNETEEGGDPLLFSIGGRDGTIRRVRVCNSNSLGRLCLSVRNASWIDSAPET